MDDLRAKITEASARQILRYRVEGVQTPMADAVRAADYEQAIAVQDRVAAMMDLPVAGWKAGGTDKAARDRLRVPGPFCGRIFASRLVSSPASLDFLTIGGCIVECEIAIRLGRDLPAGHYEFEAIEAAIESYHPSFEIIDFTWPDFRSLTGVDIFADNGGCGGAVLGDFSGGHRPEDLMNTQLTMTIDGAIIRQAPVGRPWTAIVENARCLINHLGQREIGLVEGQYVLTGTLTGLTELRAGSTIHAEFGDSGGVAATFPRVARGC